MLVVTSYYPSSSVHLFFRVLRRTGNAYTIKLPRKMRTHPTFYVGRLGRITSTRLLPVKKSLALKHLHELLVLAVLTISPSLKFGYLPVKLVISEAEIS